MSRVSQANTAWAQLLGRGRSSAGKQQLVQQFAGALPVTPEVVAAATRGMGTTGREQFLATLLGNGAGPFAHGGHGGSRAQHYAPLTGGTSEIELTNHDTGEVMSDVQASPEDQFELQRRAAMQQEQIDSELINAYGSIVQGEYSRQPAAFAEVYRPSITAFMAGKMPSAETDAIIMHRRQKEGAQRAALADFMSQNSNSMTEADAADLWQQHYSQFPEFQEGADQPMTREEQLAQKRQAEEQQFQATMDEFSKANGLGAIPIRRNEKGVLEPVVNVESMVSNRRQAATNAETATVRNATAKFNAQMKVLKGQLPPKPSITADPSEVTAWNALQAENMRQQQAAFEEFNGAIGAGGVAPGSDRPVPAPPADTPQQLSPQTFMSGPEAERAFDSGRLQPDQPFTVNGVTVAFDAGGVVYRVE